MLYAASVVEVEWTCPSCAAPQRSPWPVMLVVDGTTTWDAVRSAVGTTCGRCSARTAYRLPTVLVDRPVDPTYAVAVRPGGPGEGVAGLAGHLPPLLLAMLETVDWPDGNGAVLTHPPVVALLDRQARRARLDTAVLALLGAADVADVLRLVTGNPDLGSPGAVEVLDRLLAVAGHPPEGDRFRQAHVDLLAAVGPGGVPEARARRFLDEREAGREAMAQAGLREMRWLVGHDGHTDTTTWDATARSALVLLGLAGLAAERAHLLYVVGTAVDGRGVKSPEEIDWAIDCLRECHELCVEMKASDNAAQAAENLAIALQSRRHGDLRADTGQAVELLAGVVRHRRDEGDRPGWAQAVTNLAVTLLRLYDQTHDAEHIANATTLCRQALRARPKDEDPMGWAYTAGNLALSLTHVDADPAPGPADLAEAAALLREIWPMFAARGATMNAHKIRIDLCRVLVRLAAARRQEVIRSDLTRLTGRTVASDDVRFLALVEANPQMMSLTAAPSELSDVFHAPPGEAEESLLVEALALAGAGLDETRLLGDVERRSDYARILAVIAQRRFGDSDEAVGVVTRMRTLIDHRSAVSGAWETAGDLASLHARRGEWPAARASFDDCLAIRDWALAQSRDRTAILRHLRRAPTLARHATISRIRCGEVVAAAELVERSRLRGYAEVSGDLALGSGGLLRSASATIAEIGQVATPRRPLAYVVTSPYGSVVLLVRRSATGAVTVDAYDTAPTSGDFAALFMNVVTPELGLMTAQTVRYSTARAVDNMAGPLGQVLQPVVDVLRAEGVDRLLLIPTGPTTAYPWAAARVTDPATGGTVAVLDLLVLNQAPSAMAAGFSQQRAAGSLDAAGTGHVSVFADPERSDTDPLPGARAEAAAVVAAFPGRACAYVGADASRDALLRELPKSWITHLACHGTNDWAEFEAMRLLLADGDITLRDLGDLPVLPSRLIFLSACQTGHADVNRYSDEMIGLPYSLLASGVAAVVSTLWPIDDHVTARFVERFYRELADAHDDVPLALHRAQLWLRTSTTTGAGAARDLMAAGSNRRHTTGDPFHWAAFVCHGT